METTPLTQLLSRFWWLLVSRGVLGILFGICAFAWPGLTLVTLVMLYIETINLGRKRGEMESVMSGIPLNSVNSIEV